MIFLNNKSAMSLTVLPEVSHGFLMKSPEQVCHTVERSRRQDVVAAVIAAGNISSQRQSMQMCADKVNFLGSDGSVRCLTQHLRLYIGIYENQIVRACEHRFHQRLIPVEAVGDQTVGIDQRAVQKLMDGRVPDANLLHDQTRPLIALELDQREVRPAPQFLNGPGIRLMRIHYDHTVKSQRPVRRRSPRHRS